MKYISLFSGIEAASCAWLKLGWTPIAFAEIEPFPCAVLAHHHPGVPNHGDVTAFDWSVYRGRCAVLVGGSPCQSFSVAGLRGSLSDDRGNLALAFCKITHAIDPKYLVYENVPGILSTKDNAFGCLLAGLVGASQPLTSGLEAGRWTDAGMVVGPVRSAAWRVLDAQGAVPQRRRRVFVVSCRVSDRINPGAVLFEPEAELGQCLGNWDRAGSLFPVTNGLSGNPPPSREARTRIASALTRGADSSGKGGYAGRRREDDFNIVTNALDAHMGMGGPDDNAAQANHLVCDSLRTRRPGEGGIGGDDTHIVAASLCAHTGLHDSGGQQTFVVGASPSGGTPNGHGTSGVNDQAVAAGHVIPILEVGKGSSSRGAGPNGCGIGQSDDPMFTLQAGAQHAIAFDTTQVTSAVNRSNPQPGDPCHTLAKGSHAPTIAFQERGRAGGSNVELQSDVAYSLTAPNGGGRRQEMNLMTPTMAVRRLTVVECSRLQGFPDTQLHRVPLRPRPIEEEDARYLMSHGVECWQDRNRWMTRCPADGPMYRALGNSMAIPCLQWIGERIQLVDTLHSSDQTSQPRTSKDSPRTFRASDEQGRVREERGTHEG